MKRIKPYSAKRSKQLAKYKKLRIEYLKYNPYCERCRLPACEIHHRRGRSGEMLNNTDYFMAVCRPCHNHIHDNVLESKEKGYLINTTI